MRFNKKKEAREHTRALRTESGGVWSVGMTSSALLFRREICLRVLWPSRRPATLLDDDENEEDFEQEVKFEEKKIQNPKHVQKP